MKKFYILQVNCLLRMFGRSEISFNTRSTERVLRTMSNKLHRARSRREFEEICRYYGI